VNCLEIKPHPHGTKVEVHGDELTTDAQIRTRSPRRVFLRIARADAGVRCRHADEAGLHSVWKQEASGSNGVATLAAITQCTTDVRIGTGVASVYSRTPTLLGMSAATLQRLSSGRALLGLGVSSPPLVEQWHGLSFDQPLRRLRETIEIIRQTTAGGTVDYSGDVFDIGPYTMALETSTDVPIFNAAIGDANRRLTGEYADGWLPAFVPQSSFSATVADVRECASGRPRAG